MDRRIVTSRRVIKNSKKNRSREHKKNSRKINNIKSPRYASRRTKSISPRTPRKKKKDLRYGFIKQSRQQIRKNNSPVKSRVIHSISSSDGKHKLAFVRRRAIE